MQKNIAVVFGGLSSENEVSIVTGVMAANLLDGARYAVWPVYIAQNGGFFTGKALLDTENFREGRQNFIPAAIAEGRLYERHGKKWRELCRLDGALNCCHGRGGEDGAVAGLLDLNGIPCASPGIMPSSVFMDKAAAKLIARSLGVPVLPWLRICEADYARRSAFAVRCIEERLKYPVIVKPVRSGSSIGISVAEDRARLTFALNAAFAYDTAVIAEKFLEKRREVNCAAYKKGEEVVVSPCEEPKTEHKFLTFADKYMGTAKTGGGTFPADIPPALSEKVRGYTKLLYRRTEMTGIVRADFLLSEGEVYFNEMNTVPGALAWYLASEKLAGFGQVLTALIEQGICDYRARAGKKMLANCGVLRTCRGKGRRE